MHTHTHAHTHTYAHIHMHKHTYTCRLVSLAKPLQRAIGWNNQLMREMCRVWWLASRLAAADKEEHQSSAGVRGVHQEQSSAGLRSV